MEQNRESRNRCTYIWKLDFDVEKIIVFSAKYTGITRYQHWGKKWASILASRHTQKFTPKWLIDLVATGKIIKCLEENLGENFCKDLLDMLQKKHKQNIGKLDFIKIK